jgi:hypothetical protein
MRDIILGACEVVIYAKHLMALSYELIAEVRSKKASTTGNENAFHFKAGKPRGPASQGFADCTKILNRR